MRILIHLTVFLISTLPLCGQQVWSLTDCVQYALGHNLDLNIQNNLVKTQESNLRESKASLFPSLNIGSGLSFNFGRNIDGNTNAITFDRTVSNNYWVGSSIDLFQGFVRQRTIGFNKYLLAAGKAKGEVVKNRLIYDIISAYYVSRYSAGLTNVAARQVTLAKMQYERMKKLVDIGKESPLMAQDLKSQWAADQLNLTKAANQEREKLLELRQLLRLTQHIEFAIDTLKNGDFSIKSLPDMDDLFMTSVQIMPDVREQEYLLFAAMKDLSISRGQLAPRLYLSAGWYTNYFDGSDLPYFNQIENNQNQQIQMGLVIPVFNNGLTSGNIQRKKIALKNQQLQLQKQEDQLYIEIFRIYNNTKAAKDEYDASMELLKQSRLSLQNVAKKLEEGLAGTTDYEVAKQRLLSAEIARLKAQLTYQMNVTFLEYYRTGSWAHIY